MTKKKIDREKNKLQNNNQKNLFRKGNEKKCTSIIISISRNAFIYGVVVVREELYIHSKCLKLF